MRIHIKRFMFLYHVKKWKCCNSSFLVKLWIFGCGGMIWLHFKSVKSLPCYHRIPSNSVKCRHRILLFIASFLTVTLVNFSHQISSISVHINWSTYPTFLQVCPRVSYINCFFISYLAALGPSFGNCREDSLTTFVLLSVFYSVFDLKFTGRLVTRLCP